MSAMAEGCRMYPRMRIVCVCVCVKSPEFHRISRKESERELNVFVLMLKCLPDSPGLCLQGGSSTSSSLLVAYLLDFFKGRTYFLFSGLDCFWYEIYFSILELCP